MKKERDEAKEETQHAKLAVDVTGDAKAWVEDDLAWVRDALAVVKEAKCKAEAETALLEVKRTSLLLELKAIKDEVSSLQFQAGKDKEAM